MGTFLNSCSRCSLICFEQFNFADALSPGMKGIGVSDHQIQSKWLIYLWKDFFCFDSSLDYNNCDMLIVLLSFFSE